MKCYVSEKHIRLVGKAWEVREYLRKQMKKGEEGVSLQSYLTRCGKKTGRQKPLRLLKS